jgi:osmotically inducible protein OsmC
MPTRTGNAVWKGSLRDGNGTVGVATDAFSELPYSFTSRFEEGTGTNPEELIAAAHAGCFSMAFAGALDRAGYKSESIRTTAKVSVEPADGGFAIKRSVLETEGQVADIGEDEFQRIAADAKENCPVSKALAGVEIELEAKLT